MYYIKHNSEFYVKSQIIFYPIEKEKDVIIRWSNNIERAQKFLSVEKAKEIKNMLGCTSAKVVEI